MQFTKKDNVHGLLVAIDFQKAFDSVNWHFLYETLHRFRFGSSFIEWVKTFYCDITSCIMNNGYSRGYFEIERGVRQGDPLSAYLFILVFEVLAIHIRSNQNIKGISVGNIETKVTIFADDLTAFLKDKSSYDSLVSSLALFKKCSGLNVNVDKTEAYWLGKDHKSPPAKLPSVKKVNKPIKILGIYFTYDEELKIKLNYEHVIHANEKTLNLWKWRDLTVFGQVQIIKTFVVPKISYCTNIISLNTGKLNEINSLLFRFLWKGNDKIKRSVVVNNYELGGLKMAYLESHIKAQKITCLKRHYQDYPSTWKNILDFYLKNVGERFLLKCNFLVSQLQLQLPEYYKECLLIWNSLQQPVPSKTDQEIINEYIWNNKQILIENRTVYSKNLRDKGLLKISDLLNLQGGFMKVEEFLASGFTCTESFLLMSCIDALPSKWRKQLKFTKKET